MLVERYPIFMRGIGGTFRPELRFGVFECGDGWFEILDRFCFQCESSVRYTVERKSEHIKDQALLVRIKNKFGEMRISVAQSNPHISRCSTVAQMHARETCELCGLPGHMTRGRWLQVLCSQCQNKSGEKIY